MSPINNQGPEVVAAAAPRTRTHVPSEPCDGSGLGPSLLHDRQRWNISARTPIFSSVCVVVGLAAQAECPMSRQRMYVVQYSP